MWVLCATLAAIPPSMRKAAEMPFAHSFCGHFLISCVGTVLCTCCYPTCKAYGYRNALCSLIFLALFQTDFLTTNVGTVRFTCCYPTFSAYGCRNALCSLIFLALFDQLCGYCVLYLLLPHLQCVRLQKCPLQTHFFGTI